MTYIIAEMACSHDGSEELAELIIDGAGRAGADAVQLQVWRAARLVVPEHPARPLLDGLELAPEVWTRLIQRVRKEHPSLDLVGCVYEPEGLELCDSLGVDAFKIHAGDLANHALLERVADTGRRIDLSVGAATLDEVQRALELIRSRSSCEIWLMYGYQMFPTPTDAIHLRYLRTLAELFGLPVGYQDHTDAESPAAFWLPAAAIGLGIHALEKHMTHDRSRRGVDHESALEPDEMSRFVAMVRQIDEAMGSGRPRPLLPAELEYRKGASKTLVAAVDLEPGQLLEPPHVLALRSPLPGLPPDRLDHLLGRKVARHVRAFQPVLERDLEESLEGNGVSRGGGV